MSRARAERLPPAARRAAILDATLPLVQQHGAAVTVRHIAAAAGVAEGTIFTVFRDKQELLDAVTSRAMDPEPALRLIAAVDPRLPLRERLIHVVAISRTHLRRSFVLVAALGLTLTVDEQVARRRRAVNDAFRDAITACIEPDAAQLTTSPDELAHLLRLLVFAADHPATTTGRTLDDAEIVDPLLDGVRHPRH